MFPLWLRHVAQSPPSVAHPIVDVERDTPMRIRDQECAELSRLWAHSRGISQLSTFLIFPHSFFPAQKGGTQPER